MLCLSGFQLRMFSLGAPVISRSEEASLIGLSINAFMSLILYI